MKHYPIGLVCCIAAVLAARTAQAQEAPGAESTATETQSSPSEVTTPVGVETSQSEPATWQPFEPPKYSLRTGVELSLGLAADPTGALGYGVAPALGVRGYLGFGLSDRLSLRGELLATMVGGSAMLGGAVAVHVHLGVFVFGVGPVAAALLSVGTSGAELRPYLGLDARLGFMVPIGADERGHFAPRLSFLLGSQQLVGLEGPPGNYTVIPTFSVGFGAF